MNIFWQRFSSYQQKPWHGHGVYFKSHRLILILILFMWCVHKIKPNRRIGADLVNNVKRWIFLFLLIYDRIAQTCCLSDLLSLLCSWNLGSVSRFTIHSIDKIYSSSSNMKVSQLKMKMHVMWCCHVVLVNRGRVRGISQCHVVLQFAMHWKV